MTDRTLIIGDDIGIFLAVARSLGRRGLEVHVAPSDPSAPGLASRYIDAVHILPPYHLGAAGWVEALRDLIAAHNYRLILPCSDSSLLMLAHHAESLGRTRLALPNERALHVFTDKAETRLLATSLAVPVAAASPIGAESDPAELGGQLGFPLVLKPCTSYLLGDPQMKRAAQIVRDERALERALAVNRGDHWLAESFFRGEGIGVSALAQGGRVRLAWQHRRLKAVSETGASSVRIGQPPDPQLLAHVEALAAATALDGVAMFEFRRDPASGAHILLEVNPRFWGSLPLAVAAGADFPAALWEMLTGGECAPGPIPRVTAIKRSMTGEFDRLVGEIRMPRSAAGKVIPTLSMLRFLATLLVGPRFDSWAADDRGPFMAERRQLARRLTEAFGRGLRRIARAPRAAPGGLEAADR